MTALIVAWPIVALLFALALCRGIKIGEARDRAIARRTRPAEEPPREDAA